MFKLKVRKNLDITPGVPFLPILKNLDIINLVIAFTLSGLPNGIEGISCSWVFLKIDR
jgi:hypothetical protein